MRYNHNLIIEIELDTIIRNHSRKSMGNQGNFRAAFQQISGHGLEIRKREVV